MPKRTEPLEETPFQRMERMTKKLMAVPKKEVDKVKRRKEIAKLKAARG